ncbi:hypothetical protein SSPIM334S_04665 [Streptomyces spiroverticillatus]
MTAALVTGAEGVMTDRTVVGENLSLPLFRTLSGVLAGHPYLKVVVDRTEHTWHLLDTAVHPFHVDYVATRVLGMSMAALDADLDAFNASVYTDPDRRFLLGVLSLHTDEDAEGQDRTFLVLETTEADTMGGELLAAFYEFVRERVDGRLPVLLKPANHRQEEELSAISEQRVPRVLSHELFGNRIRTPLNPGDATGRLRFFRTHAEYAAAESALGWADIVAMPCLPDDVPRVAGFVNTAPITPLSHTNVLASGWGIPNAIVRDLEQLVEADGLDGAWVRYRVREDEILFERLDQEPELRAPAWHQQRIRLDRQRRGVGGLRGRPAPARRSGRRPGEGRGPLRRRTAGRRVPARRGHGTALRRHLTVAGDGDGAGRGGVHAVPDLPGQPLPADPARPRHRRGLARRSARRDDGRRSCGLGPPAVAE